MAPVDAGSGPPGRGRRRATSTPGDRRREELSEQGEPVGPLAVSGANVDVAGAAQQHQASAPRRGEGARPAHGQVRIIVGRHDDRGEAQRGARDGGEVGQRRSPWPFGIGRRHQQRHRDQAAAAVRPVRDGEAAQGVRDQDRGVAGRCDGVADRAVEGLDPRGSPRRVGEGSRWRPRPGFEPGSTVLQTAPSQMEQGQVRPLAGEDSRTRRGNGERPRAQNTVCTRPRTACSVGRLSPAVAPPANRVCS